MNITAEITGIKYTPFLCKKLTEYNLEEFHTAFAKVSTFILDFDEKTQMALSWWVSAKRTRSYPYARVYDSLNFSGKKVTIIPMLKDEGVEGDRDFLQWDTVSLMSLLGVYVIISYYDDAIKSSNYDGKITKQKFNYLFLKDHLINLSSYQSDALHWNLSQIDKIAEVGDKAIESYRKISEKLNVKMHSMPLVKRRLEKIKKSKREFMEFSRYLARKAQRVEKVTIQPKEKLDGVKGSITITNYLGGNYHFTSDEVEIHNQNIYLIDAKHTGKNSLPSIGDIKDGLVKMILFTNLENVKLNGKSYNPVPILKLTTGENFDLRKLSNAQKKLINLLKKEAKTNGFKILINRTITA